MAIEYNFKYMPLVGKLSGESMVRQTEKAINEIAQIVNDNTAQAEIINTLAETANANSVKALKKANEALDTSSRVYIKETLAVDLDNYCESQLIYVNNTASQNLPVAHKGFLEVKTNDDKTQATQVFVDDVDKIIYIRTGEVTAQPVGDVINYVASYGDWVEIPTTDLLNSLYLPLSGGTMTGSLFMTRANDRVIGFNIKDNGTNFDCGWNFENRDGAGFALRSVDFGGNNSTDKGAFHFWARNDTTSPELVGKPDGTLTWNGNDVITSAGGTMTGSINMKDKALNLGMGNDDDGRIYNISNQLRLAGGHNTSTGSYIDIGSSSSGTKGIVLAAGNGDGTTKQLKAVYDGTLTWDGAGLGGTYLDRANSNIATDLTLPKTGTYLVITGHNSSAGLNSIFIVRTGANNAFKMAGGANITMTCSGTTISVTPTNGTVTVHYIYLG